MINIKENTDSDDSSDDSDFFEDDYTDQDFVHSNGHSQDERTDIFPGDFRTISQFTPIKPQNNYGKDDEDLSEFMKCVVKVIGPFQFQINTN